MEEDKLTSFPLGHQVQKGIFIREGERPNTKGVVQTQDGKGKFVMEAKELDVEEEDFDWSPTDYYGGGPF